VKLTVPVGDDFVPESVSLTAAVHVVAWLTTTEAGVHVTIVPVDRRFTVMLALPLLPACGLTPP
jgi:hypothetical protein